MERMSPTLAEFQTIADALKEKRDTGNCINDALVTTLTMDTDQLEFERALLYLEMQDLIPMIVKLRRRYCEEVLEYLDEDLDIFNIKPILVVPKIMEEPE